jgi:hypothetical protein
MERILKYVLALLIIAASAELRAQRFTAENNESYWYNENVYHVSGSGAKLDTLNYCRVKRNKIRSVTTYKFFTNVDSQQISRIEYDTNGIEKRDAQKVTSEALACIDCSGEKFAPKSHRRRTAQRTGDHKEIWIRDENGYVIEYRRLTRSFVARLVDLAWGGSSDYRRTFIYSDNYTKVTEVRQQKRMFRVFKRWEEPSYTYERVSNDKGDLLSEFLREEMPDGTVRLHWGYTYHYEYYP